MKRLFKIILMLIIISSCAKDYDILNDNWNNSVTVGGGSLTIPIGETDSIFLTDYLDLNSIDMLKVDDDGNYYLEFSQEINNEISMSDIIDNVSITGLTSNFDKSFPLPDLSSISVAQSDIDDIIPVTFPIDTGFTLNYSFEEAKNYGLVKLDSLIIRSGNIKFNITLQIDGMENFTNLIPVDLEFSYPKRYFMYVDGSPVGDNSSGEDENIVYMLKGVANPQAQGIIDFPSIEISKITFDISENHPFNFTDDFCFKKLTIHIHPSDVSYITGSTAYFNFTTLIGSDNNDKLVHFQSLYGLVNYQAETVSQSISFDQIPDFMKDEDVVLDFYNPYLKLEMNTNLGVPMKIDASLTPKFNNSFGNENAIKLSLDTPVSDNPDKIANKSYWLSSKKPSDLEQGYEWENADIASLIKKIPDVLDVTVTPYTDMSKENHYVDFDADYSVNGLFSFRVPFSFGSELNFPMSTTIDDVPSILTDIISSTNGTLTLGGEIVSMFPVGVKINFFFLDETGKKLDVEVEPQIIQSIEQEGVPPVKMPLDLAITPSKLDSDIKSVVMELTLLPGVTSGIPISENSFLWAKLYVRIPGGLTIDMDDLSDDFSD